MKVDLAANNENATEGSDAQWRSRSLPNKLGTVFIVQAVAVSCATLLGIYATAAVLEDVLIRRALKDETAHYLKLLDSNPTAQVPNTFNMKGYLESPAREKVEIPTELDNLAPGFHNLRLTNGEHPLVLVSESKHGLLTLVFDQQNVGKLALLFGLVPLVLVLTFIYLASLTAYRFSKRAISPVIWLANEVSKWDPKNPRETNLVSEKLPADLEGETQVLAEALSGYIQRIDELVERERTFTRDASHELRSPLTIIKLACEVLLSDDRIDKFTERNVRRIEASSRDMESLIEAFLLLARDAESGLPAEELSINHLIEDEIDRAQPLLAQKNVQLNFIAQHELRIDAPAKVVGVMIGNLIRNACRYTDQGSVTVAIVDQSVNVADTGRGMSEQDLSQIFQPFFRGQGAARGGHGVGLTIVRRLSDRYKWPVEMTSTLGVGTSATISFPSAVIKPLE